MCLTHIQLRDRKSEKQSEWVGNSFHSLQIECLKQMVISVGRRRGEVRILIDILGICLKGVKVTHLMYKANLSYYTLHKYLTTMSKQGLLIKACNDDGYEVYSVTERGRIVLDKLREVEYILRA